MNFHVKSFSKEVFKKILKKLPDILREKNAKIFVSFGFLLVHRTSNNLRLYYASRNTALLTNLIYLAAKPHHSVKQMYREYKGLDVLGSLMTRAEDSAYIFNRPLQIRLNATYV